MLETLTSSNEVAGQALDKLEILCYTFTGGNYHD